MGFNGKSYSHNVLTDLQGGQADEYYHLTAQQYNDLLSLTFDKLYDKEAGIERIINIDDKLIKFQSPDLDDLTQDFEFFRISTPWVSEENEFRLSFIASPSKENIILELRNNYAGIRFIGGGMQKIETFGSDDWFELGEESKFRNVLYIGPDVDNGNGIILNANLGIGWMSGQEISYGVIKSGSNLQIKSESGKSIYIGSILSNEDLYVSKIASEEGEIEGFIKIFHPDYYEISDTKFLWKSGSKKLETIGNNFVLTDIGLKIENTDGSLVKILNAELSGGEVTNPIVDIKDVEARQEGNLLGEWTIMKYDNPYPGSGDLIIGHQVIHTGGYIDNPWFEDELCKTKIFGNNVYLNADASDTNYGFVYFKDKFLDSDIQLSESGVAGWDSWFTKNSIVGNINELVSTKKKLFCRW